MEQDIKNKILELKKRKDTAILAHYYVDGSVQEIAGFTGDSYYLAEKATKLTDQYLLFCGVTFMGESAKILNPGKNVYMADNTADCPMADIDKIKKVREKYPGKKFYSAGHRQFCPNMKKITIEKVLKRLENLDNDIKLNNSIIIKARKPLERMLVLAK